MTDRVIRVVLDSRGVQTGVRKAEGSLGRLEQRQKGITSGFKRAALAATAFAGALATREILQLTNTYQGLQNRLRVVTDSQEELNAAQSRLTDIAQATRAPLEATVGLFSRASIAADELGASQEQLFRLTELSGKALAVSGSSAAEASGALRQLSQSFSSGIVRGEEFNSILEGAFPLAQAAARGLDAAGGSVGKLRSLVITGKVSSQEFFEAILKGGGELDEQFAKTEVTISQAGITIRNSLINLVGSIAESTGAGAAFASTLQGLSGFIDDLAGALTGTLGPLDDTSAGFNTFAISVIAAGSALSAIFSTLRVGKEFFVAFAEGLGGVAAGIVQLAKGNFTEAAAIFEDTSGFDRASLSVTDFFEAFNENIEGASLRINDILLPSFRAIAEETDRLGGGGKETVSDTLIGDPVKFLEAAEGVGEFVAAVAQAGTELQLQADLGEDAAEAIKRYREDLALAAAVNELFGDLLPTPEVLALKEAFIATAEAGIASQRALREEIEASELTQTFEDQIEALNEEIMLLDASNEALGINAQLRALAAGATVMQAEEIGKLTEILLDEQDALRNEAATLQGFFEEVGASAQRTLSGFLADPLSEGLDELPFKFAQVLQQLAADALASQLFEILKGLGSGGAGGGAGGVLGFIGGLFGGGFQAGGQVRGGQPILVGERGAELFTPPGSGAVQPNVNIAQAAQAPPVVNVINVSDPADVPSGIESPEGEQAIINVIQRNPDAVRRLLG